MSSTYFTGEMQLTPTEACIVDTTPPTFAGVQSVTPQNSGALLVAWNAASGTPTPLEYKVYIGLGVVSAAALFAMDPVAHVNTLQALVFTLNDQATYLVKDQVYTIGVRSEDDLGNTETNTVTLQATAIASGNVAQIIQQAAQDLTLAATSISESADKIDAAADVIESVDFPSLAESIKTAIKALPLCGLDTEITASGEVDAEIISVIDLEC